MLDKKCTLSRLAQEVKMLPQVTRNLRVADKAKVMQNADVQALVQSLSEHELASGRILVRQSGTEPVVRVMVEAESMALCEKCAKSVVDEIKRKGYMID